MDLIDIYDILRFQIILEEGENMSGLRGPKSKTEAELKASGSWRKAKDTDEVELENPQSGRGDENPPEWLTEDEVRIWGQFLPKALEMKTYSNADHFSFGLFCRAANDLLSVMAELQTQGAIYDASFYSKDGTEKSVPKKHPLVDVERVRRDTYNKYADQFGFNPLARTRLKIAPYVKIPVPSVSDAGAGPVSDDEFQDMMGIKKTT